MLFRKIQDFISLVLLQSNQGLTIDLSRGYRCLTADLILQYAHHEDLGSLRSPRFVHPLLEAADHLVTSTQWATYFRRTFAVVEFLVMLLPNRALKNLSPELLALYEFEKV